MGREVGMKRIYKVGGLACTSSFGPATHRVCLKTAEEDEGDAIVSIKLVINGLGGRDETNVRGGWAWCASTRSGLLPVGIM
jgi:hypothetical protein